MPRNYDSVDFKFSWDGDYIVDETGDIQDTSEDYLLSLQQEIQTRVKSTLGDWRDNEGIEASLDDFVGEPNTPETANEIQRRVVSSLSGLVSPSDLRVRIVPVHIHKVLIAIGIDVMPTAKNGLTTSETITTSFVYDFFENNILVPRSELDKFAGR